MTLGQQVGILAQGSEFVTLGFESRGMVSMRSGQNGTSGLSAMVSVHGACEAETGPAPTHHPSSLGASVRGTMQLNSASVILSPAQAV